MDRNLDLHLSLAKAVGKTTDERIREFHKGNISYIEATSPVSRRERRKAAQVEKRRKKKEWSAKNFTKRITRVPIVEETLKEFPYINVIHHPILDDVSFPLILNHKDIISEEIGNEPITDEVFIDIVKCIFNGKE